MSYTAYGWLLTVVRPTLVSTYAFVNPVVAVLLGYALAGEALSVDALLAGVVVVAAVALMVLAPREAPSKELPRPIPPFSNR
jgi:drug/metabolite transporter (DMT)-like permease